MNTTAMENTSQANPAGATSEAGPGAMRQVWWATLGLLAVVDEQTVRLVDTLVQKGKEYEPSVKEGFKKAGKGIRETTEAVGTQLKDLGEGIEEKVSATAKRMGVPSKNEIESLSRKVDELSTRVEELLTRLGQARGEGAGE